MLSFLLSKCRTLSQYTRTCAFISSRKEGVVLLMLIFTKITIFEQHYVLITCTEFYENPFP
jgi:hypothetical protein